MSKDEIAGLNDAIAPASSGADGDTDKGSVTTVTPQEVQEPQRKVFGHIFRSKEGAKAEVSNRAYQAVVGIFEGGEHLRKLRGNGHHMAQRVAKVAADLMDERWIEEG